MASLLRFRKRIRDLHLPNGRLVKVEVNDACSTQHVTDEDGRVHGTARPPAVAIQMRTSTPTVRQAFKYDDDMGLWAPLPERAP